MRTVKLTQPDAWRQMPPTGSLRPWITDRGSLTARIMAHIDDFNLVRLKQLRAKPWRDEFRALGLRGGACAITREVLLRDGTKPLVFAHTVAHPRDLRGAWRGLSRLGARPLAEMLFHDPGISRRPMEYRKIDPRHALYRRAVEVSHIEAATLWARRSVFLKRGRPLLVTEVFLQERIHV
jgi:chorismate--pyruvate lyase